MFITNEDFSEWGIEGRSPWAPVCLVKTISSVSQKNGVASEEEYKLASVIFDPKSLPINLFRNKSTLLKKDLWLFGT